MKSLFSLLQTPWSLRFLFAFLVCSPAGLQGAAYIQCLQVGPDVVCVAGGTLDLTTVTIGGPGSATSGLNPTVPISSSYFIIGASGTNSFVTGLPSAPSVGPGSSFLALGTATGSAFGWDSVTLRLPAGTTNGILDLDPLNITATFAGTTLAALGLSDNTTTTIYTDIGGITGNNVTLFANTPIPEPSSTLLIGSLLTVFVCRRSRRSI
ncbi:MAG: PEP-CTERM sorting domain-containing protein [Verrucomicrobiota bacterium]